MRSADRIAYTWMELPAVSAVIASLTALLASTLSVRGAQSGAEKAITIPMEDCKATRPKKIFGAAKNDLVKRGIFEMDGRKIALYLPKAKTYSINNTGSNDTAFENTCTCLSIDQDGDGSLDETERWYANLPIRIGDKMFDVVEIAADGGRIVLKPSLKPLAGVVLDRKCPDFSFQTADGTPVTLAGLAGRVFLLDVWSVT